MSELRERALREKIENKGHIFYDPYPHKVIVTQLFIALETSEATEEEIAKEFYQCYKHLLDGGSVSELPINILDADIKGTIDDIIDGEYHSLDKETDVEDND